MTTQTAEKALIPVTDQKEIEKIFLSDGLQKAIEAIKKDALNFVADITTATGRKACASKAMEVAKQKIIIDNAGKDLKEQYKIKVDQIDTVRKSARDILDRVKFEVRKPLTDWEMEQDRIEQAKRDAVELEMMMEEAVAENELYDRQKDVERREAELKAQEDARIAKEVAEQAEKDRIEREARIAAEARESAEREAKEAIEKAQREKIEAELKAKQDAERAVLEQKEAAERAEQERKDAIVRAEVEKQAAILKAECETAERIAKIEAEKAEKARLEAEAEAKKAANVAHQRKINKEALDGLTKLGIEPDFGKIIISAIAHGKIKHVTINY